jgi:hypothetical protein
LIVFGGPILRAQEPKEAPGSDFQLHKRMPNFMVELLKFGVKLAMVPNSLLLSRGSADKYCVSGQFQFCTHRNNPQKILLHFAAPNFFGITER